MSRAERETVLIRWNNTRTDYPRESSVHQIFEEQAGRTPEAAAVVFRGTQLSYRALNERANRVAHRLRKEGVKPGALVPICAERSLEMIVGLLGILKAGAAYAPIDPTLPERRMSELLETLGATTLLVSHSRLLRHLPARPALPGFCLEAESRSTAESTENLESHSRPERIGLYQLYLGFHGKTKRRLRSAPCDCPPGEGCELHPSCSLGCFSSIGAHCLRCLHIRNLGCPAERGPPCCLPSKSPIPFRVGGNHPARTGDNRLVYERAL